MPSPVRTPRVNNNDDTVRLSSLLVEIGAGVKAGDSIAEVETDKATFTEEADEDGFLLAFRAEPGDVLDVGSILAWVGASADEKPPAEEPSSPAQDKAASAEPTNPSGRGMVTATRLATNTAAAMVNTTGRRLPS